MSELPTPSCQHSLHPHVSTPYTLMSALPAPSPSEVSRQLGMEGSRQQNTGPDSNNDAVPPLRSKGDSRIRGRKT